MSIGKIPSFEDGAILGFELEALFPIAVCPSRGEFAGFEGSAPMGWAPTRTAALAEARSAVLSRLPSRAAALLDFKLDESIDRKLRGSALSWARLRHSPAPIYGSDFEVSTAPLPWPEALGLLGELSKALAASGAFTNESCSVHVNASTGDKALDAAIRNERVCFGIGQRALLAEWGRSDCIHAPSSLDLKVPGAPTHRVAALGRLSFEEFADELAAEGPRYLETREGRDWSQLFEVASAHAKKRHAVVDRGRVEPSGGGRYFEFRFAGGTGCERDPRRLAALAAECSAALFRAA